MGDIVVAVDIGTSKVSTVIGKINPLNQRVEIIGKGVSPCTGVKKGIITDIESTSKSIRASVDLAEAMCGLKVVSAYVNIIGMHVSIYDKRGSVAVSGESHEITAKDVETVLYSVRNLPIDEDKQVIDVIPRQYVVDGYDEINDPVGMAGLKLEVEAHVVAGKITSVQNIIKSMERAGIKVEGIVIEGMSTGELLLTHDEKEMGGVLIDVGGGVTDISFFKNRKLIFYDSIPVGGDHITNDIAMGLKINYSEAEKIKREYGIALTSLVKNDYEFFVDDINNGKKKSVRVSEVVNIIEARVYEIFALAMEMLKKSGVAENHIQGVVLTGRGVINMDGCIQIASEIFESPVRIPSSKAIGITDADIVTAAGIVGYASKMYRNINCVKQISINRQKTMKKEEGNFVNRLFEFFKKIF